MRNYVTGLRFCLLYNSFNIELQIFSEMLCEIMAETSVSINMFSPTGNDLMV